MARVLVIEGGARQRASTLLTAEGFTVFTAVGTQEATEVVEGLRPDVVLVEVDSPTVRILEMCDALRAESATPIVVVSGQCPESAAVAAFAAGADSVVIEPVGPHELVARVRAVLRRAPRAPEVANDVIAIGPVRLDRARRELSVDGELIMVPRREFEIAEVLMREAGRVVTRDVLVRELWGTMRDTKSLDVQVGRLRTRLSRAGAGKCIVTVRGVGFRFATAEEMDADVATELDVRLVATPGEPEITIDLVGETTAIESSAST
jgi:DNA-binding response OmpR family regulator